MMVIILRYDSDEFIEKRLVGAPATGFRLYLFARKKWIQKGHRRSYFHGATVVNKANTSEHKGVTMGNMINGWNIYAENSSMLYHEYGHVIQSRYFGLSYLLFSRYSECYCSRQGQRLLDGSYGQSVFTRLFRTGRVGSNCREFI